MVPRTGRIAPTPTAPSERAGRPSSKARRAALRRRSWGGCHPKAQPDGGRSAATVWLFDLDNTLHDASHAVFPHLHASMADYVATHLGLSDDEAGALRQRYWLRYGATLLGLVRHHGVRAAHFLEETHLLPGLETRLRTSMHDRAVLARLPGRKLILTNAPRAYAHRVLDTLRLTPLFDAVVTIEDMAMFGALRPKPDARMLRRLAARLRVPASRCVLVEDTLVHLKAARSVGMRGVWMQRYLGGRFRGHFRNGVNAGLRKGENAPRMCPKPAYLHAKIVSLRTLLTIR